MDLIVILLLLVCAVMLVTGKALNINITHLHKVEEQEKPETPTEQKPEANEDGKELSEFLQNFWGVLNEE